MSGDDSEAQRAVYVEKMPSSGYLARLMVAPWDGRQDSSGTYVGPTLISTTTLVALLLEFFWSFVLGFAVVSSRFYTGLGTTSNGLQDGFFIGVIHASIWLLAWVWATDYNLKRHLNWAITIGHLVKFRGGRRQEDPFGPSDPRSVKGYYRTVQGPDYGLLALVLYAGMQFAGAALAGAFLHAFALGNVPNPTATLLSAEAGSAITAMQGPVALAGAELDAATAGLVWFIEFFGTMVIVLANIYNDERHQDKNNDASDRGENEYANHVRTGVITAMAILAMTTMLYPLGSYSFGNVPYFAGLTGIGVNVASGAAATDKVGNPPGTRLVDWAHYLFTPLAAGVAGGLVAFFFSFILQYNDVQGRNVGNLRVMQRQQYRSPKTQLTQQLLSKRSGQASGLRERGGPLPVRAFN